MRLYKMELYKICHKKIFTIGALGVVMIILFAFIYQVADEIATVNKVKYTGYRAVQVNREITEEFKGVLTDEKVERIIEKYGFPSKVEHGWNYFRDANFLNEYVLHYLSDGYMNNENDYRVAAKAYPIAETILGEVEIYTGEKIVLEYYHGWEAFLEVLSIGMVMGSILILCCLSGLFAGEGQAGMLPLLFTAKEGKDKDIRIKIAAAVTIAAGVWCVIFFLDLFLCGIVYGFDGLRCYNGVVVSFPCPRRVSTIPMSNYILIAAVLSFFGMISLCFITMCISAYYESVFHAVVVSAICYCAPILAAMFVNGVVEKILYAAPIFMVIYQIIEDIYDIWMLLIGISAAVSLACAAKAYRKAGAPAI